jgi:hypothetical protein
MACFTSTFQFGEITLTAWDQLDEFGVMTKS